jgi:hypothetical protein
MSTGHSLVLKAAPSCLAFRGHCGFRNHSLQSISVRSSEPSPEKSCQLNWSMRHPPPQIIFLKTALMSRGRRAKLSAKQRIGLCGPWKAGQFLHAMGCAFGKRPVPIQFMLAPQGGTLPAASASNLFRELGISWRLPLTEKVRGWRFRVGPIPVCQFVRQHPQRLNSVGYRVGNPWSHRRSFQVRNDSPGSENTDRPPMRSRLCNILAANLGRMGGCERPVTIRFEDIAVVLGTQ